MAKNYKSVAQQLMNAAKVAEFFALMLAESAHRVSGRYTDAYQRLDRAIQDAEQALKDEDQ